MAMVKTGVIVIDPGHGGKYEIGDSSANNATSASGVLEKNITLRMAFLVREHLNDFVLKEGHQITVLLTREADVNVSLAGRANIAKKNKADLFLSIHCNGFNGSVRGTETLIRPAASNARYADDLVYARIIQNAVFNTIQRFDTKAKDRGVKDQVLGVLNDDYLGVQTRGCLVELEFIDVKAVDFLLNIGPTSPEVRSKIAKAIAQALINAL